MTNTPISSNNDPYDPNKIIRVGKFKGQLADNSVKRPAEIIKEDEHSIVMANFRHLHKFWIAKVPKFGVEEIVFQIDRFATPISFIKPAHCMLAFKMKKVPNFS